MEITKELKEKLLKTESAEEVKALLGDEVTEEETARLWYEIRKTREPRDLEKVDDDEMEAVNGGVCIFNGEYASDGKEVGCIAFSYINWQEANYEICPNSEKGHDWEEIRRFTMADHHYVEIRCKKCGYTTKYLVNAGQ